MGPAINPTCSVVTHSQERTKILELLYEEQRVQTAHWILQLLRPAPERQASKISNYEKTTSLCPGTHETVVDLRNGS